ncbi:hypothetical protein DMX11_15540 [Pseudomonas sp. LB-090624]|nr:hypothetical protein DMX11_15540 [Pseudomonas sp. LB-090624]
MGKLTFCTAQLGRRSFLHSCVLLGVGSAVCGVLPAVAGKPVERPAFVVINGWVLPSRYFRNEPA